jgi:uncharacterized repeat protein (TIGR01451 family)
VDALSTAYFTNQIPIYFIGERIPSAPEGTTLSQTEQSEWSSLTRLSPPSGSGGDGTVAVHSSIPFASNPILDGMLGTVTNFAYPARLDIATNLDPATEVLGTSGGADVLLAYPGFQVADTNQTRLFTQDVRVSPPDDPGSTNVLRALFENTVLWLLREESCIDIAIYLQAGPTSNSAPVGQPLAYEVTVTRGGESQCPATGAVVTELLPAGVQFVSAQSTQGTSAYDPVARQVTWRIGYLGASSAPSLTITLMPVAVGTITNVTEVRINGTWVNQDDSASTNVVDVLPGPSLAPTLGIRLVSPSQYELQLTGVADVNYTVEASTDLKTWVAVANVVGPSWSMIVRTSGSTNAAKLFYRARVAP